MFVCRRCARAIQPYYAAVQQGARTLHLRERTERPPAFLQLQQKPPNLHRLSQTDCRQTAVSSDAHRHQTAELQAFKHPDVHHAENQVSLGLDVIPRLSALQEVSEAEAIRIPVSSALPCVSSTLQPYVEESETLRKLVQLGVNLWKLEQRPNVGSMLVRLDFKEDVAPRLLFLKDLGVEECNLGALLTKNPFILTESLDRLEARADYLKSKKFSAQSVAAMVTKAPYLLNFSVERMDNRLGFFYQELGLSAEKTRKLVIRLPKLLCGSLEPVKENLKVFELEFGFRGNEVQHIVTTVPKVLMANKRKLTQIFDFVHNTMDVPLFVIAKFPQVLNGRFLRIRERHMFLDFLGRAQYDPSQAAYIPLDRLVSLPDDAFCSEFALASVEDFERFQKTL